VLLLTRRPGWRVADCHLPALNDLVATEIVTNSKAKVSERSKFLAQAFQAAAKRARKLGGWSNMPENFSHEAKAKRLYGGDMERELQTQFIERLVCVCTAQSRL
jgi:hypothetical protein